MLLVLLVVGCGDSGASEEMSPAEASPVEVFVVGVAPSPRLVAKRPLCPVLDDSGARIPCVLGDGCLCHFFPASPGWPARSYCGGVCEPR